MIFADLARRASKFAIDNSPTILTTIGVVGTITTAYLAGKASFEAADIIRLKEATDEERGDIVPAPRELLKERFKLVWKLYIPAATMGTASVICIIGANHIGSRRYAGLAAATSIVEKTLEEYKDKVVEKIGERKEEQIRNEIMQDRINNSWDQQPFLIHGIPEDGEVFYDKFSGRYVWNTQEGIRSLVNDLNELILKDYYATLADFYYSIGLPALPYSHEMGWSVDKRPRVKFSSHLTPTNIPVHAFEFDIEPVRDYMRFH